MIHLHHSDYVTRVKLSVSFSIYQRSRYRNNAATPLNSAVERVYIYSADMAYDWSAPLEE